jgi:hypothetical protein
MSWLGGLLGWSSGPKPVTVEPERREPSWTTQEELENARKYDLAYGDPSAGFFQPGAMMRMPRTFMEMRRAFDTRSESNLPSQPIDQSMADRLYAAWLATRSSPVAAIGFDPRAIISAPSKMTEGQDLNYGGVYNRRRDEIFTTGQFDSTFAHEAIHRGVQKLREAKMLPSAVAVADNEHLTRLLMQKYFGDVERGMGPEGDRQIDAAEAWKKRSIIPVPDLISQLEAAASKYIAQQRPRGPR